MKNEGILFIISGPSGVGKTSLAREAISRVTKDFNIKKVTTYTTRPIRENETDCQDYFFLSQEEFENKFKNGFFLETTKYDNHKYGSPAHILEDLKLGKSFVIVTDMLGIKNISNLHKDSIFIWISPPSIKELRRRIIKRQGHAENKIEDRLTLAEQEMKEAHEKTRIINWFLVNEVFEKSVNELEKIIKKELNSKIK
ncbi:hypothetical protein GF322_00730 [Candidatus Dependentiae bacterium]|nr:hypothetical protein [Candidatus Dependentiae bacterium]